MDVANQPSARDARVIIMAKAPTPGRCKTRLARHCGPARAARLHRAMLEHAVAQIRAQTSAPMEMVCAPWTRHPAFARLARRYRLRLRRQALGGLGRRMYLALTREPDPGRGALLMGTDQPQIVADLIQRANACLATDANALWLAPTYDGGYWMLAVRYMDPRLFANCCWGTPRVARRTHTNARRIGYRLYQAPFERDIDTARDLQKIGRRTRVAISRRATMPGRQEAGGAKGQVAPA